MNQYISLLTVGVTDMARSRRFYDEGFGWSPAFQMDHIAFYQLNGVLFSIFDKAQLEQDMAEGERAGTGAFAMAHNVRSREAVQPAMDALIAAGGTLLRAPDEPPHGGFRGYVADPDGHAWEIAWMPAFEMDAEGNIRFAS